MCECLEKFGSGVTKHVTLTNVFEAQLRLSGYLSATPTESMSRFSEELGVDLFVKREDLTPIRSFKVRGALNKLLKLSKYQSSQGVVCASAGNHAQGVAYSCRLLNVQGVVFLPKNTPKQKVEQVRYLGGDRVKIVITGSTFDQCCASAEQYSRKYDKTFVHPFDDADVIAGQGTAGLELVSSIKTPLDALYLPVGGGGLAAGIAVVMKALWPKTKLIGVEAEGSSAMRESIKNNLLVTLKDVDTFADGTAVKTVGAKGFEICNALLDDVVEVSKANIVEAIFEYNNKMGLVVEPSGALTYAAVKSAKHQKKRACRDCAIGWE